MQVPGTIPYAWPYDGDLDPQRLALLVCGAQKGIVNGILPGTSDRLAVDRAIAAVAEAVRAAGGVVLWVRHGVHRTTGRPSFLPERGSVAWTLAQRPAAGDRVVDCAGWDGCFGSDLDSVLRSEGRTHVALGGYASELTVDSTVRTLNDRGYECAVLTDACAPVDPGLGRRAHASLTMSGGIFGALATSGALVAALRADRDLVLELDSDLDLERTSS